MNLSSMEKSLEVEQQVKASQFGGSRGEKRKTLCKK